jgi:hypothetical protein
MFFVLSEAVRVIDETAMSKPNIDHVKRAGHGCYILVKISAD